MHKTIYLKDYRPSDFFVEEINLEVDIFHHHTLVSSEMKIKKNPKLFGEKLNLELQGEGLELIQIMLNQQILPHEKYQLSPDKLVILNVAEDELVLSISNKIYPSLNKALEGFYQSGTQLCTQCEPEGFRRITYFIDRPDVMAIYKTRMIADKTIFPFLLCNGNKISSGDLPENRHFVEWFDPFKKPSYLFAMVAGDFDVAKDFFITKSGRKIDLEIFVDKGNLTKTCHAMKSLQESMKWDEEKFGLEYDLDLYMIVAVDSFNMGAMENKGLNIFNSTYALADERSATDHDFQNIQAVIGHEYFHNWSGNRVTCRDWFQLTLKEGLTVFRDQEFTSDMLSRAVKRIEDVRLLKEAQFAEDSSPLSHPIRPLSYVEINNFYTRTVYEKGAEVIRMIHTLLGWEKFRLGMDEYFSRFDGQAVTTEDFIHAMEMASGRDLSQFKNWYSRAGTPTLKIKSQIIQNQLTLSIEQQYPLTSHKVSDENVLHMPFVIGILDKKSKRIQEIKLEVKKLNESFSIPSGPEIILSLNRGFSAPVNVDYDYSPQDLMFLMAHDDDPYCKYEATQKIYQHFFKLELEYFKTHGKLMEGLDAQLMEAFAKLTNDESIDYSFKSYLLELPSEGSLSQHMDGPDFKVNHEVISHFKFKLGLHFQNHFLSEYEKLSSVNQVDLTPEGFGRRALKNQLLSYLVASKTKVGQELLNNHFFKSTNMTEELAGLQLFIQSGVALEHDSIQSFYQKWRRDSLVMLKWFAALAAFSPTEVALFRLKKLEQDPLFLKDVPNYLRALYLQFAKNNLASFHARDGEAYKFVANKIIKIDAFNPQVASRLASSFSMFPKLDITSKEQMRESLQIIKNSHPSKDTEEVITKYLKES